MRSSILTADGTMPPVMARSGTPTFRRAGPPTRMADGSGSGRGAGPGSTAPPGDSHHAITIGPNVDPPPQVANALFVNRRFATVVPQHAFANGSKVDPVAVRPGASVLE